jgi:hypothetical protein
MNRLDQIQLPLQGEDQLQSPTSYAIANIHNVCVF